MKEVIYKAGDKVIFTSEKSHKREPKFYPKPGTIGFVNGVWDGTLSVKWEQGSTSDRDLWYAHINDVELIEIANP